MLNVLPIGCTFMFASSSCCSTFLPRLCGDLFNFSQSRIYEVVSHCSLSCIFLVTNDAEHNVLCLSDTRMPSLVKCLFKPFVHFLKTGLFMSFYWILWVFTYYEYKTFDIRVANIFLSLCLAFFIFLILSFQDWKFLSW